MERIIWSNLDLDINNWDFPDDEELTDNQKWERMTEDNNIFLDDERANLNIVLKNPILIIADLGLWNGRRSGYKIIKSGNIKDILSDSNAEFIKWFSDDHDIKAVAVHHDGTNYYTYRVIRDMDKIQPLLDKIYNQEVVTKDIINKYTQSILKPVAKVYGW
jgi:hypothetical protein